MLVPIPNTAPNKTETEDNTPMFSDIDSVGWAKDQHQALAKGGIVSWL